MTGVPNPVINQEIINLEVNLKTERVSDQPLTFVH